MDEAHQKKNEKSKDIYPTLAPPEVRTYLNASLYLLDYYSYRKATDSSFSYQTWADKLEILSKSYLRFAVCGKRKISQDLISKFSKYFQFTEAEQEYFVLLVHYSQTQDQEQKKIFGRKLTQLLKAQSRFSQVDVNKDILYDPLNVMLRNVLSFSDSAKDERSLSGYFQVDLATIQKSLETLKNAGWIETCETSKTWKAKHDSVQVQSKPNNESLEAYHRASLAKAIALAQGLEPSERSYRSLGLALSPEQYADFLKDMNESLTRLYSKYDSDEIQGKRMYQINLNLFPWTKEI